MLSQDSADDARNSQSLHHTGHAIPTSARFAQAPGLSATLSREWPRLADLFERVNRPSLMRCCGVTSELMASLLRRAGVDAQTVSCHVTLHSPQGTAHIGRGYARQGQIDSHYVVLTEDSLIDAALAGLKVIPALIHCPEAIAMPRPPGPWRGAECWLTPDIQAIWQPCPDDAAAARQRHTEKMKAALIMKQWAASGRLPKRLS